MCGSVNGTIKCTKFTFKKYARGMECFYCAATLDKQNTYLQFKNPAAKRKNTKRNLVPCCAECARIQNGTYSFEEMLQIGCVLERARLAKSKEIIENEDV